MSLPAPPGVLAQLHGRQQPGVNGHRQQVWELEPRGEMGLRFKAGSVPMDEGHSGSLTIQEMKARTEGIPRCYAWAKWPSPHVDTKEGCPEE